MGILLINHKAEKSCVQKPVWLKQSPRAWNEALDTYLKSMGLNLLNQTLHLCRKMEGNHLLHFSSLCGRYPHCSAKQGYYGNVKPRFIQSFQSLTMDRYILAQHALH
jgi:hypothetical protein